MGRGPDGYLVRLGEVAEVRLAVGRRSQPLALERRHRPVDGDHSAIQGERAGHLRRAVKKRLAEIQQTLPKDMHVEINIDNGVFIAASLEERGVPR